MHNTQIAEVCHSANRALQRQNQMMGDDISPEWLDLDPETRQSAVEGVENALTGIGPEEMHESWMAFKMAHGWVYGEKKSLTDRTHPQMVPYHQLPIEQRRKDELFIGIVQVLSHG